MYNYIFNPESNRKVNINTKLGKSIVINFFNKIYGGARSKKYCEMNESSGKCRGTNKMPNDDLCERKGKSYWCRKTKKKIQLDKVQISESPKIYKINTSVLEFDFENVPNLLKNPTPPGVWDDPNREDWTWGDKNHPEEWEEKENYWKEMQRIHVINKKKEKDYWKKVLKLKLLRGFKEGDIIENTWPNPLSQPTEKYIIEKDNNNEFVVNIYWN